MKLTNQGSAAGEDYVFDAPKLVLNVPRRAIDNLNQVK